MDGEGGGPPSSRPARGGSRCAEQHAHPEWVVRRGVGLPREDPRRDGERARGGTVLRGGAPVLPRFPGDRAGQRGAAVSSGGPARGPGTGRRGDRRIRRLGLEGARGRGPAPAFRAPAPSRPARGRDRPRGGIVLARSVGSPRLARGGPRVPRGGPGPRCGGLTSKSRGPRPPPRPTRTGAP